MQLLSDNQVDPHFLTDRQAVRMQNLVHDLEWRTRLWFERDVKILRDQVGAVRNINTGITKLVDDAAHLSPGIRHSTALVGRRNRRHKQHRDQQAAMQTSTSRR